MISATFWVMGGWFLYLLAARLLNRDVAIISATVYLFLPYGIPSSLAFQPDPMMIMFIVAALYYIIRYSDDVRLSTLLLSNPRIVLHISCEYLVATVSEHGRCDEGIVLANNLASFRKQRERLRGGLSASLSKGQYVQGFERQSASRGWSVLARRNRPKTGVQNR